MFSAIREDITAFRGLPAKYEICPIMHVRRGLVTTGPGWLETSRLRLPQLSSRFKIGFYSLIIMILSVVSLLVPLFLFTYKADGRSLSRWSCE
jgi:hypothetical protein